VALMSFKKPSTWPLEFQMPLESSRPGPRLSETNLMVLRQIVRCARRDSIDCYMIKHSPAGEWCE